MVYYKKIPFKFIWISDLKLNEKKSRMTQIKFPRVQRFIFKGSTKVELSLKREFPVYASGYSPSVSLPRSRFFFLPRWITRLSHGRDSQFVIFARWRNSDEKRVAPMDVRFPSDCQSWAKSWAVSWLNEEVWNLDEFGWFLYKFGLNLKETWIG